MKNSFGTTLILTSLKMISYPDPYISVPSYPDPSYPDSYISDTSNPDPFVPNPYVPDPSYFDPYIFYPSNPNPSNSDSSILTLLFLTPLIIFCITSLLQTKLKLPILTFFLFLQNLCIFYV